MFEIVYYVAASVDGFIATPDGGVDWLSVVEAEGEDYGYQEFYDSVDSLIMGSGTYAFVLRHGEWHYPGKPCRVMTSRQLPVISADVTLATGSPEQVVIDLQDKGCRRAWLVGGGRLAGAFRAAGLITEYIISHIPVTLGSGIPLLVGDHEVEELEIADSKSFESGLVQTRYRPSRLDS